MKPHSDLFLCIAGTGSSGNCYLINFGDTSIILDAGIKYAEIVNLLNRNKFLFISHHHGDHAKYLNDFASRGIPNYFDSVEKTNEFEVLPFKLYHDVENYGYYFWIKPYNHYLAYITDTSKIDVEFQKLNTLIIEASYDDELIDEQVINDKIEPFLYSRIKNSHLSFQKSIEFVKKIDRRCHLMNVIFIHLSDSRSNEAKLIEMAKKVTAANVYAARKNQIINLIKF